MPEVNAAPAVETRKVVIQGEKFELNVPFYAGYKLNAREAAVLSQTFFEGIRNNTAKLVKEMKEGKMTMAECEEKIRNYCKTYKLSLIHI